MVEGAGRDRRGAGAASGRLLDMGAARRSFRGTNWPVWLGAAAALILATVIGLLPLMNRPEPAHDDTAGRRGRRRRRKSPSNR